MKCAKCKSTELASKTLCAACLKKSGEKSKRRTAKRKAANLCTRCGKTQPTSGFTCDSCKDRTNKKSKQIYSENKSLNKCCKCGCSPPLTSKTLCESCLKINKNKTKDIYDKRIAADLCKWCGKQPPVEYRTSCQACGDKYKIVQKKLYEKRLANGLCVLCGKPIDGNCETKCCVSCLAVYKARRDALKEKVYTAYGGYICNCCRETEPSFLSIDHVYNNGAEERRKYKNGTGFYNWIIKRNFPADYQVLCMNCQWGKRKNNGICPHKLQNINKTV